MTKIRVLLADDHALVRESIRQFLDKETDIEVVGEAGDGEQMVALAGELRPDVIVADVAMPKINGIEATKQVKALDPSIAILILTAYDFDQYVFALLEAGAAGYLLKDICSQELINGIYAIYRGDSVLHPAIARKVTQRFRNTHKSHELRSFELLTDRELGVLKLAAQGKTNKEIADELSLSVRTIESHVGHIFNKLGVGSRTEAVILALKKGWVGLE
ncbi:MAG: DNA-binding response regulator [Candidatus Aquicultor secundus]|uniref:DNA-binding response regulator n=1 Tax=Candidatus Aquicultor secundus TaxID=1973895 RepID=A0A2M7TAY9_9ACTN|nr:response regulator transcription factor [Candidatus Aquicultor secundus]NCO65406.1 response regulator transcription factor [Solirubrobacter sp.]PIU27092.1 MAG: DNA-binding response regulator [Candidatus Aquicultor secundus]PIW21212.1 MAG: DNA-binding response regulator [Candidatus Aquicultor secundus]PIY40783.1 MAG: DNA-binding response regulator [Candidatus Aquicultor secundus]PIZ41842.1 MAG: DNA-binding response regulator [Candidatus Aquicultor secundus]